MDTKTFIETSLAELRSQIGDQKCLCGLSGGVDSTVAAALVHKAVPGCLTCVYVDTGLMRLGETEEVEKLFRNQWNIPFVRVDAAGLFLAKLQGVTDPEQKRKIIGEAFVRVFEAEAQKIGDASLLVQGTILPDIEESQKANLVKSHHNVGGLPENMTFAGLVEPLRDLQKSQVREVGLALGMSEKLVWRQTFPGPGLAVRCLGEVTEDKLATLRLADRIVREEIEAAKLAVWQYFAVLTGLRSVGVKDGKRMYGDVIAVRAVHSEDTTHAQWFDIPRETLQRLSQRLTTEIAEVCRVVYDITDKPPGTIEWE